MAKKINFKTIDEVNRASNALKDLHVEHVCVRYPKWIKEHGDMRTPKPEEIKNIYIVVRNKYLSDAKAAFKMAELVPCKIKGARHYETIALNHSHYQPQFDCKCRQCGKTFKSVVKEAAWCSKDCRHAHRIERRNAKKNEES